MDVKELAKKFSAEDLAKAIEIQKRASKPVPLEVPNIKRLVGFAKGVVEDAATGLSQKDVEQYAYETLMEAVYGPDIFDWLNKQDIY